MKIDREEYGGINELLRSENFADKRDVIASSSNIFTILFSPGGPIYGFSVLLILLGSSVWSIFFYKNIEIPNFYWQWDQNAIARGVISLLSVLSSGAIFLFINSKLRYLFGVWGKIFTRKIFHVWILTHIIYNLYCIFSISPNFFSFYFIGPCLIFAFAFLDIYRIMYVSHSKKKKLYAVAECVCRFHRIKSQNNDRNLMRDPSTSKSVALLPFYIFSILVAFNSASDALSYMKHERKWVRFVNHPDKIAIYKVGDYWIVKEVVRVSYFDSEIGQKVLVVMPGSQLIKIEEKSYDSIEMTKNEYKIIDFSSMYFDQSKLEFHPKILRHLGEKFE